MTYEELAEDLINHLISKRVYSMDIDYEIRQYFEEKEAENLKRKIREHAQKLNKIGKGFNKITIVKSNA